MRLSNRYALLASGIILAPLIAGCAGSMPGSAASSSPMSFFVTSAGSGKGADLGGLRAFWALLDVKLHLLTFA